MKNMNKRGLTMIPTMAIATTASYVTSGPATIQLINDLVEVVESSQSPSNNGKTLPTHAGFGVRFELNSIGGNDDEEGHVMDLNCRVDLLTSI